MKYCQSPSEVPVQPHYAAIMFESFTIPGDERSRTHPGHGYSESTEHVCKYIAFKDKTEMEDWVRMQMRNKFTESRFTIIESFPKTIVTTIHVA